MAIFCSSPETFFVEEIPAYLPQGEGSHTYAWLEKRDLTTLEAVRRLANLVGVEAREVGFAGMKDRHATTRQWISVPGVEPARLLEISSVDFRILEARKHRNKLRTGHLWGNRFEVILKDPMEGELEGIGAQMELYARTGLPNRYGAQRFGSKGDNVEAGLAILRGTHHERDARKRKLLLSALQSAVFNEVLDLRAAEGGLHKVLLGDILAKASGASFVCTDPVVDQARVDQGELIPTAPLPGNRTLSPPVGTPAAILEERALASLGLVAADLEPLGRALPGTRRPVTVKVVLGDPPVEKVGETLRLRFSLPAGSYATVLLVALGVGQGPPSRPVLVSESVPEQ